MRISDWSSDVCSSDLGFCAGLDMASMAAGGSGLSARGRNADGAILPQHVTWGWRMLPMPVIAAVHGVAFGGGRSEEHTSELQSLMRISYAVFCLKKKTTQARRTVYTTQTELDHRE